MSDELIGKTIGGYEIQSRAGRGGMATVYCARQTSMNRLVAIKVLPRSLMHNDGFLERFYREVEVVAGLQHPYILPVYDFGEFDGMPYIGMALMTGGIDWTFNQKRVEVSYGVPAGNLFAERTGTAGYGGSASVFWDDWYEARSLLNGRIRVGFAAPATAVTGGCGAAANPASCTCFVTAIMPASFG
jgi:hypothetical protein